MELEMGEGGGRTPLEEFGEILREERVRNGLTVDEIASRLKITSRMVRAIEDGDMKSMPHAVYAKGFIRSYAQLLGIDEEEVKVACQALTERHEESHQETFSTVSPAPRKSSGAGRKIVLPILCLVVILGVGYWAYSRELHLQLIDTVQSWTSSAMDFAKEKTASLESPSKKEEAPKEKSPVAQPVLPPAVVDKTPSAPEKPIADQAPEKPQENADLRLPPSQLTLQTGEGTGTSMAVPTGGKRHQLVLSALTECWVHSTADDMETRQLSMQKGESFALSFDRRLDIKLGNAGGVRIKYDGKELPPPGKSGQVKNMRFPRDANR